MKEVGTLGNIKKLAIFSGFAWLLTLKPAMADSIIPAHADSFFQAIVASHVHSVAEALEIIDPSWINRASTSLVYRSRSLQYGSFEKPRVIIASEDGDFIFSFSGDARERGFGTIEIEEFDPATKTFSFSEIDFHPAAKAMIAPSFSPHSSRCIACHGEASRARPIFDNYPVWPGFYGGTDVSPSIVAEANGFEKFRAISATQAPYSGWKPLSRLDLDSLSDQNTLLNKILAKNNYQRLAREIVHSAQYSQYRDVLNYHPSSRELGRL